VAKSTARRGGSDHEKDGGYRRGRLRAPRSPRRRAIRRRPLAGLPAAHVVEAARLPKIRYGSLASTTATGGCP